jgi:hypothetical protein
LNDNSLFKYISESLKRIEIYQHITLVYFFTLLKAPGLLKNFHSERESKLGAGLADGFSKCWIATEEDSHGAVVLRY